MHPSYHVSTWHCYDREMLIPLFVQLVILDLLHILTQTVLLNIYYFIFRGKIMQNYQNTPPDYDLHNFAVPQFVSYILYSNIPINKALFAIIAL